MKLHDLLQRRALIPVQEGGLGGLVQTALLGDEDPVPPVLVCEGLDRPARFLLDHRGTAVLLHRHGERLNAALLHDFDL